MQTIIITLDPGKLENPDLDLRYKIPDRLEEVTGRELQDNGYDYIDMEDGEGGPLLGIWLQCENAAAGWPKVLELFQKEVIMGNHLDRAAEIYISEQDCAKLEDCKRVYPQ